MHKLKLIFSDRTMLIVFCLGIASGLPLLLTMSTLQAWFTDAKMDLTSIGLLSLVGLPYTLKFIWSPALDWLVPPFLGRRRGWLLISQVALILALMAMAMCNPVRSPLALSLFALLVAFFSATQDIGIDAYQIEILPVELYGLGNQIYVLGYRIGMVVAGSGALILADHFSWQATYLTMALAMSIGLVTTFFAPEPATLSVPTSLRLAIWLPLKDFFSPYGSLKGKAFWVIGFFLLYKIGGDFASTMTLPFYMKMGYSKTEVGMIAKAFGLWATIAGGLIGGVGVMFFGLRRALWIFGIAQALGYLSFAWLSHFAQNQSAPSLMALGLAIALENLSAGLGTAAYTTYMGSVVNKRFTATQYALLSSLMAVPRVFGGPPSAWLSTQLGWTGFFAFCALISIPGLLILLKINRPESKPRLVPVANRAGQQLQQRVEVRPTIENVAHVRRRRLPAELP